jgi:hypothetical protein
MLIDTVVTVIMEHTFPVGSLRGIIQQLMVGGTSFRSFSRAYVSVTL